MSASNVRALDNASSVSVKDLVGHRMDDEDPWQLQLVQRDLVWDQVRVRQLVDSLLRGYPIGSILLCRVAEGSVTKDGTAVDSSAPLILDGQQRINALFCAFTEEGSLGRFLLRVTKPVQPPEPRTSRSNKNRSLRHLVHLETEAAQIDERGQFIDLSGWQQWESQNPGVEESDITSEWLVSHGAEIDPQLDLTDESPDISDARVSTAAGWVRRLLRLWRDPRVPVLEATIESAMDVLEVFTRVNLGGVNVTGTDVYMAGVKTYWRDAERQLDRLCGEVGRPFLRNRLDAVRFLSRVAGLGIGQGDVLPLTIDRLAGDRGEDLRSAMAELAAADSMLVQRVQPFADWYLENSALRYALHQVDEALFDEVLGWVAASTKTGSGWYAENVRLIDAYLLGAAIFRYRQVLGDPFRRIALGEAILAGSRGEHFPLREIIGVTKGKTQLGGLRGRTVQGLGSGPEQDRIANDSGWLLISLVQELPAVFEPEEDFDWDHIYPKSLAGRMWTPGVGNRRNHHPRRHLINSVGNFWALNYSLNRSLKAAVGEAKFEKLDEWTASPGTKFEVMGRQLESSISETERADFIEVDRLLVTDDPDSVDQGMEVFETLIQSRTRRLLGEVLDSFPDVRLFAKDNEDVGRHDESDRPSDFTGPLGIGNPHARLVRIGRRSARTLLQERKSALATMLESALGDKSEVLDSWTGINSSDVTWVAFELAGGNCVELITRWTSADGAHVSFKAYQRRHKSGILYAEFDHIDIGVDWESSNQAIASAFVDSVARVEARYPRVAG